MSQHDDYAAFARAVAGAPPLVLELAPGQACTLVPMIQLALRHPGARGLKIAGDAEALARRVQEALATHSPELGRLLERGWHPIFDVPHDPFGGSPR